ncbi:ABC transporter substrate-binding protein [Siminovitchia fortis]|uniref:ABC transporter substrate-binding protein n=1 Tax=Siminovitchia fortis TaxID=254758 RepID=UPI0011A30397|nr:spermidine/putrescine ABC transporter substrate-binding protein [Siminovitchia fortis]
MTKIEYKRFARPFVFLLLISAVLAGCGGKSPPGAEEASGGADGEEDQITGELNLFNWSEYMPDSVIEKFEKEYGVKVNYSVYSSNDEMLAKINAGASVYDIAVGTDYMVEIMRNEDLLEPINLDNITNLNNIDDQFLDKSFDPGNGYSVPYMWGGAFIAYNKDTVDTEITSYKDLWEPEFKNSLVVLDDQRIMMGIANKMQGESMSSTDPKVIEKSKELLIDLLPNIKAFDSDSQKTMLLNGEAKAGIVWGAEAYLAYSENPSIETVLPEEGIYLGIDCFIIPKGAPNKRTAEAFIDFVLRPEISAEITEDFPYSNPNKAAHELIADEIMKHPAVNPPEEELAKGEFLKDLGEAVLDYDRAWSEIKQ